MIEGPQGQKRPLDPIQATILTAKIATGELTEEEVAKIVEAEAAVTHLSQG